VQSVWTSAIAVALVLLAVACGQRGPRPAAPSLSYNGSRPFPAVIGEAMALTPAVSGTTGHFTISPELPRGLTLDERTGVISGIPAIASAGATYTVSAQIDGTRAAFPLVLSVTEPPNHLSYSSPATGAVGIPLGPLLPSIAGTVEHYAVTPALPPGVTLDVRSGVIAGTPRAASSLAPYTVTAGSLAGNTSFILLLTVEAQVVPSRERISSLETRRTP
jgi:hypothetical protein